MSEEQKAPPNPFRAPLMKLAFAELVAAYVERRRVLFLPSGERCTGNGAASMFWRGFDGAHVGVWDRASKQMFSYAHWRAGRACAEALRIKQRIG